MKSRVRKLNTTYLLPLCALSLAVGILLGRSGHQTGYAWAALALSVIALAVMPLRMHFAGVMSLVCAAGFLLGFGAFHPSLPDAGMYTVRGIISDAVTVNGEQHKTILCDVTLDGRKAGSDAYWSFYSDETPEGLVPGMMVEFQAELYHPSGADNPDGFDFREYLLAKNIHIGLYGANELISQPCPYFSVRAVTASWRNVLSGMLHEAMDEDTAAFAVAMLLGDRSMIRSEDKAAFTRLGIAHILAVSGFHVGILAGILLFLLKRVHPAVQLVCVTAVLALYCLLTGGHVPVIRASCLILLSMYGRIRKRRVDTRWVLCSSFIITLVMMPAQIVSASFHLTYGAVLGLSIVSGRIDRIMPVAASKPVRWIQKGISASAGAQYGILLPQLYWFQELPVLGLFLNLIILPFGSLLIIGYWINLALCLYMPVAKLFGHASSFMTGLLLKGVRLSNQFPVITLWTARANLVTAILWTALLLMMCVSWRRRRRLYRVSFAVMAAVMCVSLCPMPHHGTEYIQFSVGNADAALLHDEGTVTVIDTGDDGEALSDYLHGRRIGVDNLVLTHLHADHIGGVNTLLDDGIPVRRVYIPWGAESASLDESAQELLRRLADSSIQIIRLGRGDTISLPSGTMTALWPEAGKVRPGQNANEYSLTMLLEIRGTAMLLTGDLDGRYEMYSAVPADILKVAHHGSFASTSEEFAAAVSPQAAILSGKDATRLEGVRSRVECPVYATRESGAVTVRFGDGGCQISTFK